MTISSENIQQYLGQTLYDHQADKIGKIGGIFLDDATNLPEWVTVSTGFFGTNESFVPVSDAEQHEDGLQVPFSKEKVKDAPNVEVDRGHLSSTEEDTLYSYYGVQYAEPFAQEFPGRPQPEPLGDPTVDGAGERQSQQESAPGGGRYPIATDADTVSGYTASTETDPVTQTETDPVTQTETVGARGTAADGRGEDLDRLTEAERNNPALAAAERAAAQRDSEIPADHVVVRGEERTEVIDPEAATRQARLRRWIG